MYRPCLLFISLAALGLLGGCVAPGMGGWTLNATIAGGQTVPIGFDHSGVIHGSDDDFRILQAALVPNFKTKQVMYSFGFEEKHPLRLRRVKIEDVSDDTAVYMVGDDHPRTDDKGRWLFHTPFFTPTQANTTWLFELENNVRIYRFTIVTADGQTHVLYEGANYPANIKRYFRIELGLEKIDKT